MKKILALLAMCVGLSANALTIDLNNGFQATVTSGAISSPDGHSVVTDFGTNPLVKLTNTSGLFDVNGLKVSSFYEFDPVSVDIYDADHSLLASLSLAGTFDFGASTWNTFHPGVVFTNISYMTFQSSFDLGHSFDTSTMSPSAVSAVPEVETSLMLLLGLGTIAWARKRKAR